MDIKNKKSKHAKAKEINLCHFISKKIQYVIICVGIKVKLPCLIVIRLE